MTARHAVNRQAPTGIRSKLRQFTHWTWQGFVIFFWFGLALHAPVAYQTATTEHDFAGQLWALLSGPTFLWWGVLRVIKLRAARATVTTTTTKAEEKPGAIPFAPHPLTPEQAETFMTRFQEAQISKRPTVIHQDETTEIPLVDELLNPQGGNHHAR